MAVTSAVIRFIHLHLCNVRKKLRPKPGTAGRSRNARTTNAPSLPPMRVAPRCALILVPRCEQQRKDCARMHARLLGSRLEQVADSRAHYVGQGRVCWRRAVRQRRGAHDSHDCYAPGRYSHECHAPGPDSHQCHLCPWPRLSRVPSMPLAMQDRYCRALQSQHTR